MCARHIYENLTSEFIFKVEHSVHTLCTLLVCRKIESCVLVQSIASCCHQLLFPVTLCASAVFLFIQSLKGLIL